MGLGAGWALTSIGLVAMWLAAAALQYEVTSPVKITCVWSGTGVAPCYQGDIDKVPCDYAHPPEFGDSAWVTFPARCRKHT